MNEAKKSNEGTTEKKKKKEAKAPAPVFVNKTPKGEKKGKENCTINIRKKRLLKIEEKR